MTHQLTASSLDDLIPVHRLAKEHRAALLDSAQITTIPAGRKLVATQEYPWLDYLLDGKVCMINGERKEIISSGTMRAVQPLFTTVRLREQAVVVTDSELLRLDRQLYETLSGDLPAALDSPANLELDPTETELLGLLYQACKMGKLALPSLPKVARAIQEAMNDPNISSARLARIVQMDLAVTGGLIRLANSAMYRGLKPIADVRNAIIRLGLEVTRSVVVSMAMQQVFKTRSPLIKHRMKAAWNRSVHISALSYVIARHSSGFSAEQAMLAGLLHEVGVVPILDYVSRYPTDIEDSALEAAILKLQTMVGELVVDFWGLGPEMTEVVRESGRWYRDLVSEPSYCDIVLVARLYRLNQSEARGPMPRYDQVPAYDKLRLSKPTVKHEVDFIAEATDELNAVMAMLKGANA